MANDNITELHFEWNKEKAQYEILLKKDGKGVATSLSKKVLSTLNKDQIVLLILGSVQSSLETLHEASV